MDIVPFIRELILLNECVIIRGVGGFETTYKHAAFRKNGRAIQPPNKKIYFRPELTVDNGLLENYLIESTGLSKSDAAEEIDNFVRDFFDQLRESKKLILAGIGEFAMDENSRLYFKELDDAIYLADSFGLEVLDIEEKTKSPEIRTKDDTLQLVPGRKKHTGLYVVIGILTLAIAVTFLLVISDESGKGIFRLVAHQDNEQVKTPIVFGHGQVSEVDSTRQVVEQTITKRTSIKNALTPDLEDKAVTGQNDVSTPATNISYYLVAGSFKNRRNAEIMNNRLLKQGFKTEIMTTSDGFHRIILGKFSNRKEAIEELCSFRNQTGQSVWLWERN